jgi:hypothetical protein
MLVESVTACDFAGDARIRSPVPLWRSAREGRAQRLGGDRVFSMVRAMTSAVVAGVVRDQTRPTADSRLPDPARRACNGSGAACDAELAVDVF